MESFIAVIVVAAILSLLVRHYRVENAWSEVGVDPSNVHEAMRVAEWRADIQRQRTEQERLRQQRNEEHELRKRIAEHRRWYGDYLGHDSAGIDSADDSGGGGA